MTDINPNPADFFESMFANPFDGLFRQPPKTQQRPVTEKQRRKEGLLATFSQIVEDRDMQYARTAVPRYRKEVMASCSDELKLEFAKASLMVESYLDAIRAYQGLEAVGLLPIEKSVIGIAYCLIRSPYPATPFLQENPLQLPEVDLARSFVSYHDHKGAYSQYEILKNILQTSAEANNRMGVAHFNAGTNDFAEVHFRLAIDLDKTDPEYRINLARALSRQGKTQEAVQRTSEFIYFSGIQDKKAIDSMLNARTIENELRIKRNLLSILQETSRGK